jgi:hypothetical protein
MKAARSGESLMNSNNNKRLIAVLITALMTSGALAQSRSSLFDDDDVKPPAKSDGLQTDKATSSGVRFSGSTELGMYRAVDNPDRWMHQRLRQSLNAQSDGGGLKWKTGVRLEGDAAYVGRGDRYYNSDVRNDQKLGVELTENYFDKSLGAVEMRVGKQHVVWGEMVGAFVADVVSPRDMRDFLSVDLENIRRTTWATRFENFSGDWHSELLWVPVQTYDKVGKPGADFYPYPAPPIPGYGYAINVEQQPKQEFSNGSFGARTGFLKQGWDVSAFYYMSRDVAQTFERSIVAPTASTPYPATVYTPVHDRIHQLGGTVAKDLDGVVVKAEAVVTSGRRFTMMRLDDDDGLLPSGSLDIAFGVDYNPISDLRLNFQVVDRSLQHHDSSMLLDKNEAAGSVLAAWTFNSAWETQLLYVSSFNRSEGWISPSVTWKIKPSLRLRMGADFYYGPSYGTFGRYDRNDRVIGELRWSY